MQMGPSFCWLCRGQLSLDKAGEPIFAVVKDPLGHEHRVHKACEKPAERDQRGLSAQPSDTAKIGGRSYG